SGLCHARRTVAEETVTPAGVPDPRIFELTTLYEVSRTLLGSDSANGMAFDILTAVMGLTGARWGCLFAAGPAGLTPVRCCGQREWARAPLPCTDAVRTALADLPAPIRPEGPLELPHWIRRSGAELLLPLSEGHRLHGMILLGPNRLGTPRGTVREDLLASVADLIGLAWSRFRRLSRERTTSGPLPEDLEVLRERCPPLRRILGSSTAVRELCSRLARAADTDCTVLLEGETGTGKELAARALHEMSGRKQGPFVAVDCGALPRGTEESELFGHVRGAFTGAVRDHAGCFEQARGGTLLLDEVGNVPLETQQRILRVLQERRVRPVGGEQTLNADFRLITATATDLAAAVRAGAFREDLFYRLYVYPIRLVPLREREEDIPVLARHFLAEAARGLGWPDPQADPELFELLREYPFPGNIRELQHLMERLLLDAGAGAPVRAGDLEGMLDPVAARSATSPTAPPGTERGELVLEVLRRHDFNIQAASRALESGSDPLAESLPVRDRSTLGYYFRGEMIRAWLESEGDLARAAREIAGEGALEDEVRKKMVLFLESLEEMACLCDSAEDLQNRLEERFRKLPADYTKVVRGLGQRIWQSAR
ncbi:MAG: sigma 54-interacting transcriptional regulator, partial [bacterium]